MPNAVPRELPLPVANLLPPAEAAQLQEMLKRCSPATFTAACEFRRTGDVTQLPPIIIGVIERYVARDLRPKLTDADDNLRLIEDLGLDSLTMMEFVLLAEDVLRISVTNDELTHLRTLGEVRRFVTTKVTSIGGVTTGPSESLGAPTPAGLAETS